MRPFRRLILLLFCGILTAPSAGHAQPSSGEQATATKWPAPAELTTDEDHRLMKEQLGIDILRPGANPNDPSL